MIKIQFIGILVVCTVLGLSCSRDKLTAESLICDESINYSQARVVINTSCAYSGCHDGISNPDNFKSYAGIEKFFASGRFEDRVFLTRDMPPDYAVDGPTVLTEEEINILKCWQQNEYSQF